MDIQSLLNPSPPLTDVRLSSPSPPSTPKRRTPLLTRDQRIQVQTLRGAGWSRGDIVCHFRSLGVLCTERQVQWAEAHRSTPQKHRCGVRSILDTPTRHRIIEFIISSQRTRRMSYIQLSEEMSLFVSEAIIRRALRKEGYFRRIARKKPPISEKNARLRLAWALEHVNWTREQWDLILWTDETWVTDGRHRRVWVTRKSGEEYDPTCVDEKEKYRSGWMFWACFSGGLGKGPCLFWEKEWGSINKETYSQKILPLIDGTTLHFSADLCTDLGK